MTIRKAPRKSGLEQLADDLPDQLGNLSPYLDKGVPGLRMYLRQLESWLVSNGHNADSLPTLMSLIGLDVATCYQHMLIRDTEGPGPAPVVRESRPRLHLVPDLED